MLTRRQDNPLHIALFPPHIDAPGANLEFSFILNAALDVFELRARDKNRVDQDLGLLHAIDERLSVWGWETGTGTRFAIVLDMWGRNGVEGTGLGIRDGELKPVSSAPTHSIRRTSQGHGKLTREQAFRALQTAYIRLLQNPFYVPDDHTPLAAAVSRGDGGKITSKKFIREVERIGMTWRSGAGAI